VRRVEDAETRSTLAESEIQSLNLKLQSQQTALAEAADAVQSLVDQATSAEANSRAAQSAMQTLNVELQHEQARRAIAEVALSKFETEAVRLRNEVNKLRMSDEKIDAKRDTKRDAIRDAERTEAEVAPELPAVIRSAQSLLAATISL
jgi:chromosome segregation ATPase